MELFQKIKPYIQEIVYAVLIIGVLHQLFWPASIDGTSMEPTFFSGERIAISRFLLYISPPKLDDLIVCKIDDGKKKVNIIKRIVGVAGDVVSVKDGHVTINGEVIDREVNSSFICEDGEFVLSDGQFFLLGDNGIESYDSRYFGVVDKKQLIGRVVMRWYPLNKISIY